MNKTKQADGMFNNYNKVNEIFHAKGGCWKIISLNCKTCPLRRKCAVEQLHLDSQALMHFAKKWLQHSKKTVYISGGITGMLGDNKLAFERAEKVLKNDGYQVVNPFNLDHTKNSTWSEYLKTDLDALMMCDIIYMLKDWEVSKGANKEFLSAEAWGLEVQYENSSI